MLRFHAEKFLQISQRVEALWRAFPDDDAYLTDDERLICLNKLNFANNLKYILSVCDESKLIGVKGQVDRVMHMFTIGPIRHRDIRKALVALQERIYDALAESFFMQIPPDKASYFNTPNLFGDSVTNNFPTAIYDIEEAGKCLASGRNTACVMHLMRVVEVALRAYGTGLNIMAKIKAAQSNWGTILRTVWDEVQRLNSSGDPTWTPEKRAFFEESHAHFHSIRVAWRNPSMHVEKKYDAERAEDIFSTVKSLMRHMAEHLNESGQFSP